MRQRPIAGWSGPSVRKDFNNKEHGTVGYATHAEVAKWYPGNGSGQFPHGRPNGSPPVIPAGEMRPPPLAGLTLGRGCAMPFRFGQFYECTEDSRARQLMVLHARNDGEEALLRYIDTRTEEWTTWSEFDKTKWRRPTSRRQAGDIAERAKLLGLTWHPRPRER
jgi:hypothetical protein